MKPKLTGIEAAIHIAIDTLNPRVLIPFGIKICLSTEYVKYAKALEKPEKQLTTDEKRQAVSNAIVRERPAEPVKEINLTLEKIGLVHYYGLVCKQEQNPEPCGDCGAVVTRYTKLMLVKRGEKSETTWRVVCDTCIKVYKTDKLDTPKAIEVPTLKGGTVKAVYIPYTPYTLDCKKCGKEIDLRQTRMYMHEGEGICSHCLKEAGIELKQTEIPSPF